METFIFNSFKNNLLTGKVKADDTWRFFCINNKINDIDADIFKTAENISDINMFLVDSAVNETEVDSTYLSKYVPVYYSYHRSRDTKTSDKPIFVSLANWDEFIELYPGNEHLKRYFLTPMKVTESNVSYIDSEGTGQFYRIANNDNNRNITEEYPDIEPRGFYFVRTAEELKWCADKVNGTSNILDYNNFINIVLGDNIGNPDAISKTLKDKKVIDFCIGKSPSRPFEGVFYGNGFKIQNIEVQCTSNAGGLFGYVGDYGIISMVRIFGTNIVRNYKQISITHMINDGCDVNAALLCGVNNGIITDVYAEGKVYFKGFSPEVYTVQNKTDIKDATAFSHPGENVYFPSYLCINSKANIIPYVGYFAEGVHSTVSPSAESNKNTDAIGYWNTSFEYLNDKYKPYDSYSETEWAYPSGVNDQDNDIVGHVFYYDINGMQSTQALLTNNDSSWNDYLSMVPVSRYLEGDETKYDWRITNALYSDRSIKMHQFNRVSYNTSIIAGSNYSTLQNINISAKMCCCGTFVGFMGGLAGKHAPRKAMNGICSNCCVNISATDDNTRQYYDSFDEDDSYEKVAATNRLMFCTFALENDTKWKNIIKVWVDPYGGDKPRQYAYSDQIPMIQLGLEENENDPKKNEYTVEYLGYVKNFAIDDIKKIRHNANAFSEVLSEYKYALENAGKYNFKTNYILNNINYHRPGDKSNNNRMTVSCVFDDDNKTTESEDVILDRLNSNGMDDYRHITHFDIANVKEDGTIVLKNVKFKLYGVVSDANMQTFRNLFETTYANDKSKLRSIYKLSWYSGEMEEITVKPVNSLKQYWSNNNSDYYNFTEYRITSAKNLTLYGMKYVAGGNGQLIGFTQAELYKVKINKEFTNTQVDHNIIGYFGLGETAPKGISEAACAGFLCNTVTSGKKLVGCKNYYIEKRSIKNIGALFGSFVVSHNTAFVNVSAYLDNQHKYYFDPKLEKLDLMIQFPHKLQDYAFDNRFSSFAAICEVQTDCIGDFTTNMATILSNNSNGMYKKPVNFNNVCLRYNETQGNKDGYDFYGPMYLEHFWKENLRGDNYVFSKSNDMSCPFGVANVFISEVKVNNLAIPTILESPLSNIRKFEEEVLDELSANSTDEDDDRVLAEKVSTGNILSDKVLYERIGQFTNDQNFACTDKDPVFWSINTLVDMAGDTMSCNGSSYNNVDGSNIIGCANYYDSSTEESYMDKLCNGLDTIRLGNYLGFGDYGLSHDLWTTYPSSWAIRFGASSDYTRIRDTIRGKFVSNKQPACNMYFGSDIVVKKYKKDDTYYYPQHNPYIIKEGLDNPNANGEFFNVLYKVKVKAKPKTTKDKNEPFKIDNSTVETDKATEQNRKMADDNTYSDVFKYTYETYTAPWWNPGGSIIEVGVNLTDDDTNKKYGFRFQDVEKDATIYNDELIYDGSVFHLGMQANEKCILENLAVKKTFDISSISAEDLTGLLAVDSDNKPIMYIDVSDTKFDGKNAWSLNCTVDDLNKTELYSAGDIKPTGNKYGLLLEIE